jgi:hypothetical protein
MILQYVSKDLMAVPKNRIVFFALLFLLVFSVQICLSEDITYTDKNIIRNGDFEEAEFTVWFTNYDIEQDAARDGVGGMAISEYGDQADGFFLQILMLPSVLNSATISYDLRVMENGITDASRPIDMNIYIGKSTEVEYEYGQLPSLDPIGTIHTETFTHTADWQKFSIDIDSVLITEMQAAHETGEFVFLVFSFSTNETDNITYEIQMDNVSVTVNGTQQVPPMQGKIAFFERIEETPSEDKGEEINSQGAINILDPNTKDIDTIWTSEDLKPDIKWKPDGTEIAFVSEQEHLFSPYFGDIYTIKSDGTELRKVTSQPSLQEIISGGYPHVTLSGNIQNNSSNTLGPTSIIFCPLGAQECISLSVGANDTTSFTIPNVAVLDDSNVFNQRATIYWSNNGCTNGLEWELLEGIVTNNTVDVGTISLEATTCVKLPIEYRPRELSWKRDGSKIGATITGKLFEFDNISGLPLFGDEMPTTGFLADDLEWSPIANQYLFTAFRFENGPERSVYLAIDGSVPELLVEDVELISPAWLSDGSGFIFVEDEYPVSNNPYHYDFNSKEIKKLTYMSSELIKNISVSPDSRHIVFSRCFDYSNCSLWIMDRLNPVEMWQVTEDGNIDTPDWSRVDIPENNSTDNNSNSQGSDSGGCFIENLW